MRQDHAILLYALVKGFELNVGRIVQESILDYERRKFSRNIPHPSLITLLCIKRGVKFNEAKENRSLKASLLTIVVVLKAPIESEEGSRREKPSRKRKMVETTEEPKNQVPTIAPVESNSSEGGGYEANLEQPVLSPLQAKEFQLKLKLRMKRAPL